MGRFISITIICFGLFFLLRSSVYAWQDCPFGKINDPYPGSCNNYVDTNADKICDHSQPAPNTSLAEISPKTEKFLLLFVPSSLYFISWFLVFRTGLKKRFPFLNQKSFTFFWNSALLVSFILTGTTGLITFLAGPSITLTRWHNQTGLVMLIIALFHFLRRLSYYQTYLKSLKQD